MSSILTRPDDARACYVFAHGAGAGMHHSFMAAFADGLAQRRIATLRYQFPYMEKGSKRPDPPAVAHAAVRAAVAEAAARCPGLPLFAGGKSFGGRMTSQAQAKEALPGVRGLVFVGFPLHPAGKPGHRARRASGRRAVSDAVPAGHARRARRSGLDARRGRRSRRARDRWRCSTTPTTPSTCARAAAATMRRCARRCSTRRPTGSRSTAEP